MRLSVWLNGKHTEVEDLIEMANRNVLTDSDGREVAQAVLKNDLRVAQELELLMGSGLKSYKIALAQGDVANVGDRVVAEAKRLNHPRGHDDTAFGCRKFKHTTVCD